MDDALFFQLDFGDTEGCGDEDCEACQVRRLVAAGPPDDPEERDQVLERIFAYMLGTAVKVHDVPLVVTLLQIRRRVRKRIEAARARRN